MIYFGEVRSRRKFLRKKSVNVTASYVYLCVTSCPEIYSKSKKELLLCAGNFPCGRAFAKIHHMCLPPIEKGGVRRCLSKDLKNPGQKKDIRVYFCYVLLFLSQILHSLFLVGRWLKRTWKIFQNYIHMMSLSTTILYMRGRILLILDKPWVSKSHFLAILAGVALSPQKFILQKTKKKVFIVSLDQVLQKT